MAISTTSLQYLFKTYYTPKFNEDFIYRDNEILKKIYNNRVPAQSSTIYAPIRVRRASGSTAAITEGGQHPTAAQPTDYRCSESMKIIDTHKEISQLVMNLTKSGAYNYRKAVDDLAIDAASEHGDMLDRALFNDNGYIATCASAASATSVTLATGTNMRQFYVGQAIDIFLKSAGTVNSVGVDGDTIAAITPATRTLTLTTGVATYGSIDSTYGVSPAACTSATTNLLPHGLPTLIGTGNLHSVTVSSYPEFVSYLKDLSGADVALDDIQEVIDEIELVTKGKVDMMIMSDVLYRQIQFDIVEPQTYRSPGEGMAGTGPISYRGRSKGQIPIYIAAYCNPTDDIYIIDSSALVPYHGAWMEWMDDDGKYLSKVTGWRKYEASLGTEMQILAQYRSRLGKIQNCNLS